MISPLLVMRKMYLINCWVEVFEPTKIFIKPIYLINLSLKFRKTYTLFY